MTQEKVQLVRALAGLSLTAVSAYLDILLWPVLLLIVAMAADYLSGMVKAWVTASLSSRVGIRGIVKKLCYLLAVVAGMGADWMLSMAGGGETAPSLACPLACMVALWLIVNELISILENLRDIGVPLPDFLLRAVQRLKTGTEERG